MASIRVRKGKTGTTYAVVYRDRAGRQTSESFPRRRDAEARKSAVEVELRSGRYVSPREARTTFGAWFGRWDATRSLSRTRAASDACRRDRYLLPRWGGVPLDAITHIEAQAWVRDLADRMAPASVAACFRLLKLPLDAAVHDGKLPANPVASVKLPRVVQRRKTHDDVLTGEELNRLVAATPTQYRALVYVTGWMGLRLNEVLGLRRRDVNLLRKQLTVGAQTVDEVAGVVTLKPGGKTENATRVLPLPGPVADMLAWHLAEVRPDAGPDDLVFTTSKGTVPLRGNLLRKVLQPSLSRAGLGGRRITMRQLRHTAASLMIDAGLDVQDVQQRIGHAKPSTTMDVYVHLLRARREAGTARIEAAMLAAR